MKYIQILVIMVLSLFLGSCVSKFDEPPTAPKDEPVIYDVLLYSTPTASVEVLNLNTNEHLLSAETPTKFKPTAKGDYLYRLSAEGYESYSGIFQVNPGFPTDVVNVVLTRVPAQPLQPTATLTGPDTVDAGTSAIFTLHSENGQIAISNTNGMVNLNGSFTVTINQTQTVVCLVFGATATPAVAQKTVVVRSAAPLTPPTAEIYGPDEVDADSCFTISIISNNGNFAALFGYPGSGPAPLNGQIKLKLHETTTISFVVWGNTKTPAVAVKNIRVKGQPIPAEPTASLQAPDTVAVNTDFTVGLSSTHGNLGVLSGYGVAPLNGNVIMRLSQTTTLTWVVYGNTPKPAVAAKTVIVKGAPPAVPPTASITGPDTVEANVDFPLTLVSTNGTTAVLSQYGVAPLNGTVAMQTSKTTTFTFTVYGATNTPAVATHKVVVKGTQPPPKPTVHLNADSLHITRGSAVTLTITSTNADYVVLAPLGTYVPNGNGTVTDRPTTTITYQATAYGPGGTASVSLKVIVDEPPTPPAPTATLSAPDTVDANQDFYVDVTSTNGTLAVLTNVGNVPLTGHISMRLAQTQTIILTVYGNAGTTPAVAARTVAVRGTPPAPIPTASLQAPDSIDANTDFTVNLSSTNGTTAVLTSYGVAPLSGTVTMKLQQTTTLIYMVWNSGSTPAIAQQTVHVRGTPPPQPPTAQISAPDSIDKGADFQVQLGSTHGTLAILSSFGAAPLNGTVTMSLENTSTLIYTVYGATPTPAVAQKTVYVRAGQSPTPPMAQISAPDTVDANTDFTVNLASTHGVSAVLSNYGNAPLNGQVVMRLGQTTTLVYTVTGEVGTSPASASHTVYVLVPEPVVTLDIYASPANIIKGYSSHLVWTSANADSITINKLGRVQANDNTWVSPVVTTTYIAYAWRHGAVVITDSATVTVSLPTAQVLELTLDKKYVTSNDCNKYKVRLTHDGGNKTFTLPAHQGVVKVEVQVKYEGESDGSGETYEAGFFGSVVGSDTTLIYKPGFTCPIVPDSAGVTSELWRYVGNATLPNTFQMMMFHGVLNNCDGISFGNVPSGTNSFEVGLEPEVTQGKIRFTYIPQ